LASPYNPYVTVDYMENVLLNQGNSNTGAGYLGRPTKLARRHSVGRLQPYDARVQTTVPQAPAPALWRQPQHTFFQHNRDQVFVPRPAFDWLVHLDRPLISPMELLHVSCCRPHQLTHLFKPAATQGYQSFNHAPYWMVRD